MTTKNKSQVGGIVRAVIPAAVGYFAGRGLLTPEEADTLAPLVAALAAALIGIWSLFSKRKITHDESSVQS